MKLYQKENGMNAILRNTYYDDSGRTLFKVYTPQIIGGTTTITKVLYSNESDSKGDREGALAYTAEYSGDKSGEEHEMAMQSQTREEDPPKLSQTPNSDEEVDPVSQPESPGSWFFHHRRESGEPESSISLMETSLAQSNAIHISENTLGDPPDTAALLNQFQHEERSDVKGYPFEYIAQIDWKFLKSTRFRFGDGKEVLSKNFFRKETWGWYGR
jgi:hypothetical protein